MIVVSISPESSDNVRRCAAVGSRVLGELEPSNHPSSAWRALSSRVAKPKTIERPALHSAAYRARRWFRARPATLRHFQGRSEGLAAVENSGIVLGKHSRKISRTLGQKPDLQRHRRSGSLPKEMLLSLSFALRGDGGRSKTEGGELVST